MVPDSHAEEVIGHVCMVHASVGDYSNKFLQKLRRSNYVTPKNYLDFISTYSNLLEDKDKYILGETFALSKFPSDFHQICEFAILLHITSNLLCLLRFAPSSAVYVCFTSACACQSRWWEPPLTVNNAPPPTTFKRQILKIL